MTNFHLNSYENEPVLTKFATISDGQLEAEMSTSDENTSRGSSAKLSDFEEEEKTQIQEVVKSDWREKSLS